MFTRFISEKDGKPILELEEDVLSLIGADRGDAVGIVIDADGLHLAVTSKMSPKVREAFERGLKQYHETLRRLAMGPDDPRLIE